MSDTVLVNFHCPKDLKRRFEIITKRKNLSKTSVILTLIERYIRDEIKAQRELANASIQPFDDSPLAMFTNDDDWLGGSEGF